MQTKSDQKKKVVALEIGDDLVNSKMPIHNFIILHVVKAAPVYEIFVRFK